MFLMGELKISGKGEPRPNEKGEAGKKTMYTLEHGGEFELVLSEGPKEKANFNFYVSLDESKKVSIGMEDPMQSMLNDCVNLFIKDEKGDLINLALSAEQVGALYHALENAHVAFESMAKLQKIVVVNGAA